MMPLYKAKTLVGDVLLSPFEIYIYLPSKELEEQEPRLKRIWDELDVVSSIFTLKFISQENLIDDDPYLERVFEHSNIFARILMPRSGDRIGIEIGWMAAFSNREAVIKGDLLRFVYQLCEKGLEQVSQVMIDTEHFASGSRERDERLFYLSVLERKLIGIKESIIRQDNAELKMFLVDKRRSGYGRGLTPDYLAEDFEAKKQKLELEDMDNLSIQELAALVGFDIPYFPNDRTGGSEGSLFYDPSISVEVCKFIPGSRYPGLRIGIENSRINIPSPGKEGIFAYVCTLIKYINGQGFGKKDIKDFFDELKSHIGNKEMWDTNIEEDPVGSVENEGKRSGSQNVNKLRSFDNKHVMLDEMPFNFAEKYYWFKRIYDALFRKRPINLKYDDEYAYITRMRFDQWCIHVVHALNGEKRDPFRQGISNERTSIRETLTEQGYGAIINQVGLKDKDHKFYINVNPEKIYFPEDELWDEALSYAREMDSEVME